MLKLLALVFALTSFTSFAQETPLYGTSINGMYIGGIEFWPWDDGIPGEPYPDRVIWDWDAGATELAQACMLKSNKQLVSWIKNERGDFLLKLKELKKLGGTTQFYMWTNDYTKAPVLASTEMRPAKFWHWCSGGYRPGNCGWQKYEATLTPEGVCHLPKWKQAIESLQKEIDLLKAQ